MPAIDVFHEEAGAGDPLVLINGVMMTTQSRVFQTRALFSEIIAAASRAPRSRWLEVRLMHSRSRGMRR